MYSGVCFLTFLWRIDDPVTRCHTMRGHRSVTVSRYTNLRDEKQTKTTAANFDSNFHHKSWNQRLNTLSCARMGQLWCQSSYKCTTFQMQCVRHLIVAHIQRFYRLLETGTWRNLNWASRYNYSGISKNGKTNPDLHNYKAARKKWNPSNLLTFTDKHKWEGEITSLSKSKFGTTNMTTYAVAVKR